MKCSVKIVVVLLIAVVLYTEAKTQSPSFKTYMNPVIPGDHPDATLTRVGKDFYTTGSSFNVTPVIYHSTDLVHWEAIAQPVKASWSNFGSNPGGGCWGGHIVFRNGKYWDFFSRAGSMYFVKADLPSGPWTNPVKVNDPPNLPYSLGYDNSIFIDDDNKWYLVVKNGQPNNGIVELGDDGQATGTVYNLSWLNPSPYAYSWAEGPVMWKAFGYYYYSFARDLSGGQKVMRSMVLTADKDSWEMLGDFFNVSDPLKNGSLFAEPNHCSPAVMLDDSTFWIIHPLYAKGEWIGQGRQGLLNQVRNNTNHRPTADYPVNKSFNAPGLMNYGIPWMVPKSDEFNTVQLNPEWSFWGYTADNTWSLAERPGWLRLTPRSSTKPNTIVKNDGEHNYSLITHLEFDAQSVTDEAGLRIVRGDEARYVKLFSGYNASGEKIIGFYYEAKKYSTLNTCGNDIWLRMVRVNHAISGYYSSDGVNWMQVGQSLDISAIDSYSDLSSFTGTRQGIYVQNRTAFFDNYIYRDAYTSIQAASAANQYGTVQLSGTLDSIHQNDFALYAGVEFGNGDYIKKADSVFFSASSMNSGTIEIWLDSIDSGIPAGICNISSTGSWSAFRTFRAAVNKVTGRHDVYLRFTGENNTRLLQLKSLQFHALTAAHFLSARILTDTTLAVILDKDVLKTEESPGFQISLNSVEVTLSKVEINPEDSSSVIITLSDLIQFGDVVTVSYAGGFMQTHEGLALASFRNRVVDNTLPDPAPLLIGARLTFNGDSLMLQFSKKMRSPQNFADEFSLLRNNTSVSISSVTLKSDDSSGFMFNPAERLFFEDTVSLSYSGSDILSSDNNALHSFENYPVENNSSGYPPLVTASWITKTGNQWNRLTLQFDRAIADISSQKLFFLITINGENAPISEMNCSGDTISFVTETGIKYGDVVLLNYTGGHVASLHHGLLADITDYEIANNVPQQTGTESLESKQIKIFPNPAKNEFRIISEKGFSRINIFNMNGKVVFTEKYPVDVSNVLLQPGLNRGNYLIRLTGKNTETDIKISIE